MDASSTRGRILVIDDSRDVRDIVRVFLEKKGFQVCGEGADGVEAVEKAKDLKPDLIVLDLAIPRMDGFETASVLNQTLPEVPIVLLTMYDKSAVSTPAFAVGIAAIVSKSDGLATLVQCVESLLSGQKARTASP